MFALLLLLLTPSCQDVIPVLNGFPLSGLLNSYEKRDAADRKSSV